jgi:hypothetical protein
MTQVFLVFEEGTPQSTIDEHLGLVNPNGYWTSIPPFLMETAAAEGWTFPYTITEAIEEQV